MSMLQCFQKIRPGGDWWAIEFNFLLSRLLDGSRTRFCCNLSDLWEHREYPIDLDESIENEHTESWKSTSSYVNGSGGGSGSVS